MLSVGHVTKNHVTGDLGREWGDGGGDGSGDGSGVDWGWDGVVDAPVWWGIG